MIQTQTYNLQNILGQGGMAKVYLAEHKTLGHKVAIKVLNKEYIHNENIRKRFLAEAKNLAKMNHPNVVRVMDLIEEGDMVAFVMEYIEGQTLRDYLDQKGKLPDNEIKKLFGQMLEAVGYVHEQGLVHRDIKPSNFMLDSRGNIKLLDFGIAKTMDPGSAEYTQTATSQHMGTPMYMSPEQVKSTKDVTTQSDIYSLGVVLWQMAAGRKPYDTSTLSTFDIQVKIVHEPLPETGRGWDDIIEKATKKDLKSRFKSIQNGKLEEPKSEKLQRQLSNESDKTKVEEATRTQYQSQKHKTGRASLHISTTSIDNESNILEELMNMDKGKVLNILKIKSLKKSGGLQNVILNSPEELFEIKNEWSWELVIMPMLLIFYIYAGAQIEQSKDSVFFIFLIIVSFLLMSFRVIYVCFEPKVRKYNRLKKKYKIQIDKVLDLLRIY